MSDQIDAPGTVAFEVLQWLRHRLASSGGAVREVPHANLALAVGRTKKVLHDHLELARAAGMLSRTERANTYFWSLGPNSGLQYTNAPAVDAPEDQRTVLKVDANVAISVFAYADQRSAAPFSVAMHTDGRIGIERNGRLVCELNDAERRKLLDVAANGVAAPC